MPTYEYVCTACGHEWEAEQSIKDDALKDCPKCAEATAKRQISRGTGFILKGSGWYADLYSGGGNKKADTAESSGSSAVQANDSVSKSMADRFEKVSGIKTDAGSSSGSSGSSDAGGSSGSSGSGSSGSGTPA
ncbi:MAG: zinc ribbon domain-containing protein [Polyangiaceae bacterium]|nr:zinc ribbon domain-containing protein [Polyangiaceae bacterium]MBK8936748.1 zinc ribbon domain-containing protein [Polyangiaceae bacterium]